MSTLAPAVDLPEPLPTQTPAVSGPSASGPMDPGMSLVLDVLRFAAALAVVLGHLNQRFFSGGSVGMEHLAIGSVGFFFVLSGFVIAYSIDAKPVGPREYAIARLARMYSVAVPALGLTFVLDTFGRSINPGFYRFWERDFANPLKAAALSLLFLNEAHGHEARFMTNSPYWSLGYEVPYYAAFGVMAFTRGWVRVLLLLICLALWGLPVLGLFPLWLGGVLLYRLLKENPVPKRAGWLALAAAPLFVGTAETLNELWKYKHRTFASSQSLVSNGLAELLDGRSGNSVLLLAGAIVTCCLIVAANAYREELARCLAPRAAAVRNVASCTFSLYLFHFPILCFGASLPFYDRLSVSHNLLLLAAALAACGLLSRVTEGRKGIWARWLNLIVPRKTIAS